MERYIHPTDKRIRQLIEDLELENKDFVDTVHTLFDWFDVNITYSRLNAPFFPLQRSDLDVLDMLSGTCGDYSNLLVSVFSALNYETRYAYIRVDCYNNPQDHICAAVWYSGAWVLIDATLPYRRWHGFDCQHKEYELLSTDEFLIKMKKEEAYWTDKAINRGNKKYAGLFYAPWIHEDVIIETEDKLESVFYLLSFENKDKYQIFMNYMIYSKDEAFTPTMCRIIENDIYYSFSEKQATHIWDGKQWGEEYLESTIPERYRSQYYQNMKNSIQKNLSVIRKIIAEC